MTKTVKYGPTGTLHSDLQPGDFERNRGQQAPHRLLVELEILANAVNKGPINPGKDPTRHQVLDNHLHKMYTLHHDSHHEGHQKVLGVSQTTCRHRHH
jgi:hypothetical protein